MVLIVGPLPAPRSGLRGGEYLTGLPRQFADLLLIEQPRQHVSGETRCRLGERANRHGARLGLRIQGKSRCSGALCQH
jgi:hypothetical protein